MIVFNNVCNNYKEPVENDYVVVKRKGQGVPEFDTERTILCISSEGRYDSSCARRGIITRIAQRIVEIIISSLVLVVTLPIMLVTALFIRLDSPGPALFFQKRLGRSNLLEGEALLNNDMFTVLREPPLAGKKYWVPRTFRFVKFRTMYDDARVRFSELYDYNYSEEEIEMIPFKRDKDPRVTRVGKWLRATTLDELPNFWNVLMGDIHLVGPRPEIPEMIHSYRHDQMKKFTVNPGVTGLAQINGRGRLSFQQTVKYDLEYVDNNSVVRDIKILFLTLWKVITHHGAF